MYQFSLPFQVKSQVAQILSRWNECTTHTNQHLKQKKVVSKAKTEHQNKVLRRPQLFKQIIYLHVPQVSNGIRCGVVSGLFDQLTENLGQMEVLRSYLRRQTKAVKQQNFIGLATIHDGNLPHLLGVSNLGRFAGFPKDTNHH